MQQDGTTDEPGPGRRFGQFTVVAELASGGMGRVYLARSPGGRTVAVKTLLAEDASGAVASADRRRFAREVALAQRVKGVFTASVVDADARAPMPWMATEYIAAPSLRDLVERCGTLDGPALHWVAAGVAEALVSVHAAGLVHRDVKPSNVLLPVEGPRVIDFGISQASDVTRTHAVLGTVAYAAPEQARGEVTTPASDVFSLGATLFFLAVGRAPYRDGGSGPALEQLVRAAHGDLDVTGLPPGLESLVLPCLALDPADRPTPARLLESCAARLGDRPDARGGADWLSPGWVSAIERHRERRTREVEEARQRSDPAAPTGPVSLPGRTSRLPPPPAGPGDVSGPPGVPWLRTARGRLWGVAGLLAVVAAAGLAVLRPWESGGPTVAAPDKPMEIYPVEQSAQGICPSAGVLETRVPEGRSFTADDRQSCVTISTEGSMKISALKAVRAVDNASTGQGWIVEMAFKPEDATRFAELSGRVAALDAPRNQLAIVQGDRLLSAPAVMDRLTDGRMQIAGGLNQWQAEQLASALGAR
ncbi:MULTISPECIES: protein kinase [unclassified Streptomyces]|uniref:serine/threonine-protein kinase n=1 Tax=unclassified Streptomyces TaxID=2593676 RepID=UPI003649E34A